jgi:hypothetical protein
LKNRFINNFIFCGKRRERKNARREKGGVLASVGAVAFVVRYHQQNERRGIVPNMVILGIYLGCICIILQDFFLNHTIPGIQKYRLIENLRWSLYVI